MGFMWDLLDLARTLSGFGHVHSSCSSLEHSINELNRPQHLLVFPPYSSDLQSQRGSHKHLGRVCLSALLTIPYMAVVTELTFSSDPLVVRTHILPLRILHIRLLHEITRRQYPGREIHQVVERGVTPIL